MFWKIVGAVAACLTMFSFIPQVYKIWKTKSGKDISVIMLVQFSAGATLWIVYGIYRKDAIIIVANVVTLVSLALALALHFRYK